MHFFRKSKEGMSRREFMMSSMLLGAGMSAPAVLGLLEHRRVSAQDRPMRAAMSNAGLAVTWCAQGKDTAEMWGEFLGVEIVWFDGQLDNNIQRSAVDTIATQATDFDFVALQPFSIGSLVEPLTAVINEGVPVVDLDTLIAPMDVMNDMGVLTLIAPDNVFMSEAVVTELVTQMGGEGKIAHTWGAQGHTGAQGRAQGFYNIISQYPDIEVVDDQPADWDVTRVAEIWESILNRHPDLTAGFLHNDDMALAASQVASNAGIDVLIGGIDAMTPAIDAVIEGRLVATARNSAPRVHGNGVLAGWVAANMGMEAAREEIPSFILADGPAITDAIDTDPELEDEPWKLRGYGRSTAEGLRWLQEQLVF